MLEQNLVYDLTVSRRQFFELATAGLMVSVASPLADAQRGGGAGALETRLHVGEDGFITVLSGKVEEGQGSLTELAMCAAEELRVPLNRVRMVLGDTPDTPNDGVTAGSGTTPRTTPLVRGAAAATRELLLTVAGKQFGVAPSQLQLRDGMVQYSGKSFGYADLAKSPELAAAYKNSSPAGAALTPAKDWQVLGKPQARLDARDIVTGAHRFPRDIVRPNMLYGSVLRAPSYGATLTAVDVSAAQKMAGVTVVRDGGFIACAAPTSYAARKALGAISATAQWKTADQVSSDQLYDYLKQHAGTGGRGQPTVRGSVENGLSSARHKFKAAYQVPYVQHAPMEPRAAVAEWQDGKLTVWTGTSNPPSVRQQLAQTLGVPQESVRVHVPYFGGGFGGKHTGEAAIEAARMAKVAGRPVAVHWTRAEEFTWAYFRPAALIEIEAGLDAAGAVSAWDFTNYNSGTAGLNTPYRVPNARERYLESDPPLRQSSYRVLAAAANNFARESFTDELAAAAGKDPLEFRLAHLDSDRIKNVLTAAAEKFGWSARKKNRRANVGVGLSCGTEKGSVVAACCEVEVDPQSGVPKVTEFVEAFECGAIMNPTGLRIQVEGGVMMGFGPALREEIQFKDGCLTNARFGAYKVPRYRDLPKLEVVLLDRKDMESAGAGETPLMAVAPAIANAVFDATGKPVRAMPIRAAKS